MKKILIVLYFALGLLWLSDVHAENIRLDEVVVVATREEDKIMHIPANVTLITEEDIDKATAKDVTELLRKETGIMVTNTSGSTPTGITVEARGFNNGGGNGGRTLVLIDGRKVNEADSSTPDWALIPMDNVEKIEIIRGPATAIYGDSAMAAVINIITKKGKGKPTFEVGADTGSWQRLGQKAIFQGSTDKFNYFIFGSHGEENGYRDNSNFRFQDWTGKFSYQLTPIIELTLKPGYHTDDREFPGALTADEIEIVGRRGSVAYDDQWQSDQFNMDLGVDIIQDENNKFSTFLYSNSNETNSLISSPGSGSSSVDDVEYNLSLSLRYTASHPIFRSKNKAILGMDLLREEVNSKSFFNYPDPSFPFIQRETTSYERKLLGIYLHDEYSLTDRIILGAGIRFDLSNFDFSKQSEDIVNGTTSSKQGKKDFEKFSPKASITYLLTDNFSTYYSYASTFRLPNRDELTGFFGYTPELDPENGENFEVGMKARFGRRFNGGISLYHMTVTDEILVRPPNIGDLAFGQNENFDKIIHKGIDVSMETSIIDGTTAFGSYTFVDTEIKEGPFEGAELPITPKHLGSVGAIIDMGYGISLWNQARFVGKRHLANDLANAFDKLPGYGVWDTKLSYTYKDKLGNISAFFGLNNILDKKYDEFGGISVSSVPFGSRIGFNPSPERNFISGVTYKKEF